jgi:radical SAM-linked protein
MQPNQTLLVLFSMAGGPSYLSQQETLTMWSRALIRAGMTPAFSQGFNPHPKISLPLPRSVGVDGDEDMLVAQIASFSCAPDGIADQLNRHLPEGCRVVRAEVFQARQRRYPESILYVFQPTESAWAGGLERRLEACRRMLSAGSAVEMLRIRPNERTGRTVDISVYLQRLDWDQQHVRLRCRFSGQGTARVEELIKWMGLERSQLCRPVLRTQIEWSSDGWPNQQGEQCQQKC